jgi:hypothetical protein
VHVAATGALAGFAEVREHARQRPLRFLVLPAVVVIAGVVAAGAIPAARMSEILLGYFAWQFFHYQKQNVGLLALAAKAERVSSWSLLERRAVIGAGCAGIARPVTRPELLQLRTGSPVASLRVPAGEGIIGAFAIAVGVGLFAVFRRRARDRTLRFVLLFLVMLLFPLPIFVFASPYAAVGGLTIAHGQQLGWIAVAVVAVGLVVNVASHLHDGGTVARLGYGLYLGVVMAHFVVDASFWRLRDEFRRRFLAARLPWLMSTRSLLATDASGAGVP